VLIDVEQRDGNLANPSEVRRLKQVRAEIIGHLDDDARWLVKQLWPHGRPA